MPDENKFKKLKDIDYKIPITCGLCLYGPWPAEVWGNCELHKYKHIKHDNSEEGRGVSVHVSGTCPDAVPEHAKVASLAAHVQFLRY